jgi:hypothetical protein
VLNELSAADKEALRTLLIGHNAEWWENSPETLKTTLGG